MDEATAEVDEVLHQKQLPHDLIAHHILTRLPIKPLLRFKCVSKQWYFTLSSYQFAHLYSKLSLYYKPSFPIEYLFIQNGNNYYLFSHDDHDFVDIGTTPYDINKNLFELKIDFHDVIDEKLVLIGSCNGLVCLASLNSVYFFILWNPITGKYQKYSDVELSIDSSSPFWVSWGFGYVSSVDDFKVVRVLELPATLEIRVHVFSMKFNKWTRIADEPYQDIFSLKSPTYGSFEFRPDHTNTALWFPCSFYSNRGVLVNESVYWIVSKMNGDGNKIVAFDLVGEVFDANVDLDFFSEGCRFLCNMGGCLSKCGSNMRDDFRIEILKYPGEMESIFLFRTLNLSSCEDVVGFTRTGKFFTQLRYSELGLVDPSSTPKKYTRLLTFKRLRSRSARTGYIASFVPSLTLPCIIMHLPVEQVAVQRHEVTNDMHIENRSGSEGRSLQMM